MRNFFGKGASLNFSRNGGEGKNSHIIDESQLEDTFLLVVSVNIKPVQQWLEIRDRVGKESMEGSLAKERQ